MFVRVYLFAVVCTYAGVYSLDLYMYNCMRASIHVRIFKCTKGYVRMYVCVYVEIHARCLGASTMSVSLCWDPHSSACTTLAGNKVSLRVADLTLGCKRPRIAHRR